MNFRAVLALPKTAGSAQTHKSISFIWIVWSTLYVYLCSAEKKSYRILSFFKVTILYQKGNVFLFHQHLTMKRGNYIYQGPFFLRIDSFDSDCKLCVIQGEKIRSNLLNGLTHTLLPKTLYGLILAPQNILLLNKSCSQEHFDPQHSLLSRMLCSLENFAP